MPTFHQLAGEILTRLQLTRLARATLTRNKRFAVVFHGVVSQRPAQIPLHRQPSLSVDELRLTLGWMQRNFQFLTPTEFLETDQPGVLLTFDDGFASNFTNALPVLNEFQAPAIFFVSTQHVSDPQNWLGFCRAWAKAYWGDESKVPREIGAEFYDGMSIEQLKTCANHPLITIGAHTVTHPVLTECSDEQLSYELSEAQRFLRQTTGQAVDLFAYPKSEFDQRVALAVKNVGYRAAFATDSRGLDMAAFEIPRIGIYYPTRSYLELKMSGLHRRPLIGRITSPASR